VQLTTTRLVTAEGVFRAAYGERIGSPQRANLTAALVLADGGNIRKRPVTPGDLAATLFRYFGVPLDVSYLDNQGRPRIVVENGKPISELF
jgi:hypothetical protein